MKSPTSAPTDTAHRDLALAAALCAAAVLLNVNALRSGSFLLDDIRFIFDDPLVIDRAAQPLPELLLTRHLGYPVPALVATWGAVRSVFGLHVGLLHAISVGVHALTVAAVFALGRRFGAARLPAAFGALLLAAHPVTAEPVAWMTQLGVVAATALVVPMLWLAPAAIDGDRRAALGVVGAFALALAYKPAVVALPVVLPYLAWCRNDRPGRTHAPGPWRGAFVAAAVLAACSAAATLLAHTEEAWVVADETAIDRAATVAAIAAIQARNLLLPTDLMGWYERPTPTAAIWAAGIAAWLGALGLTAALALGRRTRGGLLGLGALVALLGFVPTAGFPVAVRRFVAESHLYLPMLGVCMVSIGALDAAWRRPRWRRITALSAAAALVASGALHVAHQDRHRDPVSFWGPVIDRHPYHPKASWCLGFARLLAPDGTEAWARDDLPPAIGIWARAHLYHDPIHDRSFERDPRGLTTPMAQALRRLDEPAAARCMRALDYRADETALRRCFDLAADPELRVRLLAGLRPDPEPDPPADPPARR